MKRIAIISLILLALSACNSGPGDPAKAVEEYLQAKVDRDADALGALICSEMEADLPREATTFESVSGVAIEGMACERVGETTSVRCNGRIVAQYGTEQTEFPLVTYRVVEEDGAWKWCGESN